MRNLDIKAQIIDIELKNVLIGKCKIIGTQFDDIQRELVIVAEQNGTSIYGGMLTRVVDCEMLEDNQIISIEVGFILDGKVLRPQPFEYYDNFRISNVICIEYKGAYENLGVITDNINEKLSENNLRLTGKVYNHIKYWSNDGKEIEANVYLGVEKVNC